MPEPMRIVVDASLGIKLFIEDQFSNKVHSLFEQLADDPPAQLYAPDLFFIECANVLWKYVRWGGYSAAKARENLKDLNHLAIRSIPTRSLVENAFVIAAVEKITAYDACYVALSQQLGIPLVTGDEKLVRTLARSRYNVRWLDRF
jgi:predicted nucleic acid-binding protein